MEELELYIHIPFCARKCSYCDFLSFAGRESVIDDYINALVREIELVSENYRDRKIISVYIGGGTPSLLEDHQISTMFEALLKNFNISDIHKRRKGLFLKNRQRPLTEVSIEVNPGTVDKEKFRVYKKLGINRLSIGLQSADNEDLKVLGRIHTYEDFVRSFEDAREAGFDNINVDLMQSIPGQTLMGWKKVLALLSVWKPEHISAYSLMIEEGTEFKRRFDEGKLLLPDEDTEREIYHYTGEFLEKAGYRRYEISNYSVPGFECRHNMGYWTRKNYLGLGLHSSSMIDNIRWKNTDDLDKYISCFSGCDHYDPDIIQEEREILSYNEQMEEYMFLGLRTSDGVSRTGFLNLFHQDMDNLYSQTIDHLKDLGLISTDEDRIWLTEKGIDVSNVVLSRFLLDR